MSLQNRGFKRAEEAPSHGKVTILGDSSRIVFVTKTKSMSRLLRSTKETGR